MYIPNDSPSLVWRSHTLAYTRRCGYARLRHHRKHASFNPLALPLVATLFHCFACVCVCVLCVHVCMCVCVCGILWSLKCSGIL